ncbi:hypothetical protein [Micromonospora sp. NPDC049679]|uniref:hypothetical protein n=1 Tax=Micromonospora sp. NPDC049679 TaxID=3155920 RepID=UPI0033E5E2E7
MPEQPPVVPPDDTGRSDDPRSGENSTDGYGGWVGNVTWPGYPPGYAPGNFGGYPYPTAVLVPRPPRPRTLDTAVLLTWVGIAISLLAAVTSVVMAARYANDLSARLAPDTGASPPTAVADFISAAPVVGALLSLAFSLAVAAGLATCAVLARRGRESARIVLAAVAGAIALAQLCGSAAGAGTGVLAQSLRQPGVGTMDVSAFRTWEYVSLGLDAVLGLLALVTCVFLLVPATNRYFRPGPGRQFASQG